MFVCTGPGATAGRAESKVVVVSSWCGQSSYAATTKPDFHSPNAAGGRGTAAAAGPGDRHITAEGIPC